LRQPQLGSTDDEPLAENLTAEVGDELATAITAAGGCGDRWTLPTPDQTGARSGHPTVRGASNYATISNRNARRSTPQRRRPPRFATGFARTRSDTMGEWSLTERCPSHRTLCEHESYCDAAATASILSRFRVAGLSAKPATHATITPPNHPDHYAIHPDLSPARKHRLQPCRSTRHRTETETSSVPASSRPVSVPAIEYLRNETGHSRPDVT
jgi:hypothetical protein